MIVKMKHLVLLCMEKDSAATLEKLRALGCVHIDSSGASGGEYQEASAQDAQADAAIRAILKAASKPAAGNGYTSAGEVATAVARRESISADVEAAERMLKIYAPFGEVDPAQIALLAQKGLQTVLVKSPSGVAPTSQQNGAYSQKLSSDGKTDYYALIGGDVSPAPGIEIVPLPPQSTSSLRRRIADGKADVAAINHRLASSGALVDELRKSSPERADKIEFAAVRERLGRDGTIAWLEAWAPADAEDAIRAAARENAWGILLRDATADENPPTLIRPPKLFRPVASLFAGLGIAPAYTEADVSVPFMCYFSVFFAMLVGDGGYGALILALTLWGWKKAGKNPAAKPWLALMTVFSSATVVWGLLSNTWFGAQIPFLANPASAWLGDATYHNIMFLCFTIGVSHLVLARLWNAICKAPDSTFLAEIGWAGILAFMYFVTNSIVGIMEFPQPCMYLLYVSLALVFGFSVKPSELKTRGAELGMLPLNIMSALGDIISYVRLFAVGLASVKVAENFNAMATGLLSSDNALWLNALLFVGTLAILLVGHALNFAMAGLSVLVHAVRLNTLEFSNHKGVSWSGRAFKAFSKH
ncbi:MAG: hypothetical protein IJ802_04120 [Kiritimatiellae bacterium]|nr:hypothetical protein [Kiritimatiellia bacterium]